MTVLDAQINLLDGTPATLGDIVDGKVSLVVNVASQCGSTPQYSALETIYERYADIGFTVLGVPCNQFDAQEPGTASEIAEFCSLNYGVTFPLSEKVNVNEPEQHPICQVLTTAADDLGEAGEVEWNFEKFLLDQDGRVLRRFRPDTEPDDPQIIDAIEVALKQN